MRKVFSINTAYHRLVATYRTFIYCILAVSLFINYQTMYGKWNTVGLLLPSEPVQQQSWVDDIKTPTNKDFVAENYNKAKAKKNK